MHVYWSGPHESAGRDKCDWIVQSLKSQPNKHSRAVKVIGVRQESLRQSREAGVPPLDARRLLEGVYSAEYIQSVVGAKTRDDECLCDRSLGDVLAFWTAVLSVKAGREDMQSGRVVGVLGGSDSHVGPLGSSRHTAFNGLAVAAIGLRSEALQDERSSVLIIDLDGRCGGGTASLIANISGIRQVDVAVNSTDSYSDTANARLRIVTSISTYLDTIEESLCSLDVEKERGRNPICIYRAGVDGFEGAPGGLAGLTTEVLAERDRLVFNWCRKVGIRTVFTTGGGEVSEGVSRETLVALHRQTIETAESLLRKEQRDEKRGHK